MDRLHSAPNWLVRGVTFMMRPRLHLELEREPYVDIQKITNPIGDDPEYDTLNLRGAVINFGIAETARECSVYVDSIHHDGSLLDDERSPLPWLDESGGDAQFRPIALPKGRRRRRYFAICKADGADRCLRILTKRSATSAAHAFFMSGVFKVRVTAEAAFGASATWLEFEIHYDQSANDYKVFSVRARPRFRLWW